MNYSIKEFPARDNCVISHTIFEDGYVNSALLDEFGWYINEAECHAEGPEYVEDAVSRNNDALYEKMGWS